MNDLRSAIFWILVVKLSNELQALAISNGTSKIKSVIEIRENLHQSLLVFDLRPAFNYLLFDVLLPQLHQIVLGHGMVVGMA